MSYSKDEMINYLCNTCGYKRRTVLSWSDSQLYAIFCRKQNEAYEKAAIERRKRNKEKTKESKRKGFNPLDGEQTRMKGF